MGNPAILPPPEPPDDLPLPPPVRLHWHVYQLRGPDGARLSRGAMLLSKKTGTLTLDTIDTYCRADLVDPSGYPTLANLFEIRRVRVVSTGLLLQGMILVPSGRQLVEVPQAWWCVIAQ
jgi:hypothetical protein